MLVEFKVRNFRNFKEWLVFSLETPDAYASNKEAVCNGIIKDAVIIGSNACGKTNLGIAVMDITTHLTDTGKRYPPSLLCPEMKKKCQYQTVKSFNLFSGFFLL